MSDETWDAFISYRRRDGSAVANWVRRQLQHFKLPNEVLGALDVEAAALHQRRPRIWLDTAYERPSDDFLNRRVFPALDRSRRLLVVSTPSALEPIASDTGPQPNWLVREIDRFVSIDESTDSHRPIDLILGPGAEEHRFPGALAEAPRMDWIDLRAFTPRRIWNPFDESLDAASAKLVAGFYSVPERFLPQLRRAARRQRLLWLLVALTAAVFAALVMLSLAIYAEVQRREAVAQRNLAVARLLASEGYRIAADDSDKAKSYFLSSLALGETPNAVSGLLRLTQSDPHATMKFLELSATPTAIHARPDGQVAVGLSDGSVTLWSIGLPHSEAGERALAGAPVTKTLAGLGSPLLALARSLDQVMAIDSQGRLLKWGLADARPRVLQTLTPPDTIARRSFDNTPEVAFAESGTAAAIATYSGIVIWTPHRGVFKFARPDMAAGGPIALSPDGKRLAYPIGGDLSLQIPIRIVDLNAEQVKEIALPAPPHGAGAVLAAAFSPDGAALAVGTQEGFVQVWRLSGTPTAVRLLRHSVAARRDAHHVVEHLHVGRQGNVVASRYAGAWQVWDVPSGTPLGSPEITSTPTATYADTRQSLLLVDGNTVLVRDFSIGHLRYVACLSSASDLSVEEWRDMAGDLPLVQACQR